MKLWEILPQLKEGQTINVTYTDGNQDRYIYEDGSLRREENGYLMTMHSGTIRADFELIPQFIPFEEALAELRKGETICCEYDRKLPNETHWSGELIRITIAPDSLNQFISTDTMLHGKWWVK